MLATPHHPFTPVHLRAPLLPRRHDVVHRSRPSPEEDVACHERVLSTDLRRYELMVILDPDLEERTVAPSLDQLLGVVRQAGGSVDKLDVWGRRRLSYEINHKAEGIYAVVDLMATPASVAELDRQLRLNEAVLRTKVVRPDLQ